MKPTFTYGEVLQESLSYFNGDLLAASTVAKKYLLRDEQDRYVERTPDDMHMRLATEFARAEKKMNPSCNEAEYFQRVYRLMRKFHKVVPQGSPQSGIGNPYQIQSLSNCFVVHSPVDSISGIFKTGLEIASIQKRRGGAGVDLATLRPFGARVSNAAGISSGLTCFSDFYSYITRMIGQMGRQGALMITTTVQHPDAERYAVMKTDLTAVTGANVSFRIPDAFMHAVENDLDYVQQWPCDVPIEQAKITRTIRARDLWNVIVESAWKSAEPGLLMWDNYCRNLPANNYPHFKLLSVNPCFTGNTRILTGDGYKTLEEVWEDSGRLSHGDPAVQDSSLSVINSHGRAVASTVYKTSDKAPVFEVQLATGHRVRATANHTFLRLRNGCNERVQLHELAMGDTLPLGRAVDDLIEGSFQYPDYALLAGWVIGDGSVSQRSGVQRAHVSMWGTDIQECGPTLQDAVRRVYATSTLSSRQSLREERPEGKKQAHFDCEKAVIESSVLGRLLKDDGIEPFGRKHRVPTSIWQGDARTIAAFLRGLYSADGSVQCSEDKGTISIRLTHAADSEPRLLQEVQLLLTMLGIKSSIHLRRVAGSHPMNDGRGGTKEYARKPLYELITSGSKYCSVFMEKVGFLQEAKNVRAREWLFAHPGSNNSDIPFTSEIVSIEYVGEEPTYCLTEHANNEVIANGVAVGQCAELGLSADDSCRLITQSLPGWVIAAFTKGAEFDFDSFYDDVKLAQRMSDGLVELEIEAVQQIMHRAEPGIELDLWTRVAESARRGRRTGLGTHGLADVFYMTGLRYDSEEARLLADRIYRAQRDASYEASIDMAEERGAFPDWNWELEKDNEFIKRLPAEQLPRLQRFGRRNISNLTNAPTGSIAIESQTSSGIEPVFEHAHDRFVKITHAHANFPVDRVDAKGDKWTKFRVVHPAVKAYFATQGIACPVGDGRDFSVPLEMANKLLKAQLPDYFVTSSQIDYMKGVELQSTIQQYIDHGISKTINMPRGTTKEQVADLYLQSWKKGLKGVTIYVDGSRDGVLVATDKKPEKADSSRPEEIQDSHAPRRPETLEADVHHVKVAGQDWAVVVGLLKERPYEVFAGQGLVLPRNIQQASIKKAGSKKYALSMKLEGDEAEQVSDLREIYDSPDQRVITRSICRELRHGIAPEFVVRDLMEYEGPLTTYVSALTRVLKKYVKKAERLKQKCPECGSAMKMGDGCLQCTVCQYSKCG